MPAPETVEFGTECEDCGELVHFRKGDYATRFGRVYSTAGLEGYRINGVCELCADYAADFAVYDTRKGW